MKTTVRFIVWVLFCSTIVMAQDRPDPNMPQGTNLEVPEGWEVRLDHEMEDVIISSNPAEADVYFVNMTPGWHITTGPAGIFYHPSNTASGNFTVTSELHFFDPGDRNREGYGIFIGGSDLQGENQSYIYFLLRNTGEFLVKQRMGEETEVLQNWTPSSAIIKYESGVTENSSVMNVLEVAVVGNAISFSINDEEVASVNSSVLTTDGIFGLRANHSVNLHISDLSLNN
ncbi:hypothetical protein [Gracilimonas halophila]|uniref:3-keto-disaccharide hydrolase domain-containing protein n=1 Tax=Gracilimonas halophila TaxID=1834464 RepID=A0ABW5JFF3_9BACT